MLTVCGAVVPETRTTCAGAKSTGDARCTPGSPATADTSVAGKAANAVTRPCAPRAITQDVAPTALIDPAASAWKPSASPLRDKASASTRPTPITAIRNCRARNHRSANVTASTHPPPIAKSGEIWRDSNGAAPARACEPPTVPRSCLR